MANHKKEYRPLSSFRFDPKTEVRIESPNKSRRAFRVRYKEPGGNWTTINLPEIDAANNLYLKGVTDAEATKASLKQVLQAIYAQRDKYAPKTEMLSKNVRLVELVYEKKYPKATRRRMQKPKAPYYDLMEVVEACGINFPLATCDLEELDNHFHELFEDNPNKLYRTITWTNVLLRYLGRPPLQQIDPEKPDVRYVTEEEFVTELLPEATDPYDRLLFQIGFYTGLRLGEIYYLEHRHIRERTLWVEGQMLDSGKLVKRLKRGTEPHDAVLPSDAKPVVERWCDIHMDERREIRGRRHAERLRSICRKVWEKNRQKHLGFHDLRHSNAIWLLQNTDMRLHEVAQHLGNTAAVVEKYYSGFELKRGTIDRVADTLDSRKKKW